MQINATHAVVEIIENDVTGLEPKLHFANSLEEAKSIQQEILMDHFKPEAGFDSEELQNWLDMCEWVAIAELEPTEVAAN